MTDNEIMASVDEVFFNGEAVMMGTQDPNIQEQFALWFATTKAWFEEKGIKITPEDIQKYKNQIAEWKEKIAESMPEEMQTVMRTTSTSATVEEIAEEVAAMKKVGFWAFVILIIIIILK